MRRGEDTFLLTALGELELTNALQLRIFRHELTRVEVKAALAAWRDDVAGGIFFSVPMTAPIYQEALQLARKYTATLGARTLDILHVAAAVAAGAQAFYTFDRKQRRLARAAGLRLPISTLPG